MIPDAHRQPPETENLEHEEMASPLRRAKRMTVDLGNSRHNIVKRATQQVGWRIVSQEETPSVYWTDTSISVETVKRLSGLGCKVNHFPSMDLICRKVPLAENIGRMAKTIPGKGYEDIIPRTFTDFHDFSKYRQQQVQNRNHRKRFYIVKPNSGCMGKGIYLTSNPDPKAFEAAVVQEYVDRPLLIENRKFDLRCYVLVVSVCPPRIFFFKDGMVRLCSEQYKSINDSNVGTRCMHISNYSVNKKHKTFAVGDGTTGGKRGFDFFTEWLSAQGHDADKWWESVHDLAVKTVLAVVPSLAQVYKNCCVPGDDGLTCFELLGFDVLVRDDLKPVLCEVNHSPSLVTDTPFDAKLKLNVLTETMKIASIRRRRLTTSEYQKSEDLAQSLGIQGARKKALKRCLADEDSILCNFTRVFPSPDPVRQDLYKSIIQKGIEANSTKPLPYEARRASTPTPTPVKLKRRSRKVLSSASGISGLRRLGGDVVESPSSRLKSKTPKTPAARPEPLPPARGSLRSLSYTVCSMSTDGLFGDYPHPAKTLPKRPKPKQSPHPSLSQAYKVYF